MAAMAVVSSPAAPLMLVNSPPAVHACMHCENAQIGADSRVLACTVECWGLLRVKQLCQRISNKLPLNSQCSDTHLVDQLGGSQEALMG